ncbi:MAG: flagellar hook-basal body complex protein FliE [Hyphomonadaceae bacterium]|nr:flagellar hook-basal body complex protein FliE [Clostridia bacterium]
MKINPSFGLESMAFKPTTTTQSKQSSFQNILSDAIAQTTQAEKVNAQSTVNLLTGDVNDLHTAMIDMDKADISLRLTMQVRNKILDAYTEIMRMQV